jgi:hypothetical protein
MLAATLGFAPVTWGSQGVTPPGAAKEGAGEVGISTRTAKPGVVAGPGEKAIPAAPVTGQQDIFPPVNYLEMEGLVPATDQAPLDSILQAVGQRVEAYFRNFPNTVSLEEIHQEKVNHQGKVGITLDQKFHYLCLTPSAESELGFTEYRTNLSGDEAQPEGLADGFMLTSGFASASLVFHPLYQAESTFRYLGQQQRGGRNTLVLAFAQRPEKARAHGAFEMGKTSLPTFAQGVAWVDAESYEIVRLRTDLLKPLPEVRLDQVTTEIDFSENHFTSLAEGFWLPREVRVSVHWKGKHLRNRHQYSNFQLFRVGASEKIAKPKEADSPPRE